MARGRPRKYANDREATQARVRKHREKKNQGLSLVTPESSQVNSTFDSNFIQWVAPASQNNLPVVSGNEISAFAGLGETLIDDPGDDQGTGSEEEQACVDETDPNVFEEGEASSSGEISDREELGKLIEF